MKKITTLITLLVICAVAVSAAPVTAAVPDASLVCGLDSAEYNGQCIKCKYFEGKGKLLAAGWGKATVAGNLDHYMISGRGMVTVTDNAGDMIIYVNGFGHREEISSTTIKYSGVGSIFLVGSDVKVESISVRTHLSVRGEGWAKLCGRGWYQVGSMLESED